ncbi:hypothetical protein AK812_SmicGene18188 [Symbiodinium microadriaticum]|uniref:Uncharacterized protein n=1 Tax=Symbiodinium microadriaticum TaxID=2951 RepID=A0A1Q9DVT8_SYMMI|nr:hypothetical protein AK812_SmicGene18188 [Symbiodinium microadriaticum]
MAHSELLRRPGELCKAVTSLQASSRSQDALLADLGQRVESSATAVDRQLRLAEVDMASLRSRVTVLEESLSDAVSEATRARTEVAALREFVQAPRFQVHAKQPWPLSRAGSLQSSPRRASPSRTCEVTAQPGPPSPEQRSDGNVEGRLCKLEALTTRSLTSMEERVFSFGEGHRALESQIAGMTSSILGCGHEQQRLAVEVAKLHDTAKQVQELLQDQSKTQELRRDVTEEQKLRKEATCHLGTKLEELRREISEEQRNRSEALSRVGTKLQEESRRDLAEEQKLRKEATSLLGAQLKEEFRRDLAEEQRLRKEAMEELAAQLEEESHRDLAEEQQQRKEALILLGTQLEDQLASMADRQQHQASELGKLSRELVSNALEATKMRMKLATLGWKEGLAADAHDARLAGPSTERIWQLMHMMLARLAAKMQTVWQLMRMTLAQLVTKLNSKGFVWLRKRMMRMKLATLGWKEGLAADAHDARLAGPSTERIWQLMHMMLARLAAKMQTVWQLMRMTLAQLVTKLNSKGFVWLRKRMMRMKLATLGWKEGLAADAHDARLAGPSTERIWQLMHMMLARLAAKMQTVWQLMRMTLAQLVTKLNSKGFVWLRKRMMRMKLATLGWKEGLAADAHDARLAGPSTERIWQLMHMMLARLAAKMQTVWQLMRMTLAQLVTKLNSKGFVWLRKRMMRMKLATLGWKEGLAADAHDARLAGPSTERIWQLMHMMLARLAAKMQTVWQLMRMTLAQLVTKLNSKGFVWLRKRMMRMKLATLGWKEGLAADAHDARLAGPSTERIWQLMHMMLARLAAKMQTVWQLMRMTLAQLVTKLNSKGFVWLRKRMMRMKLATLGWKEGLAADAHDARLAGPSTERIWQLMHMMLARLAAKMQTVWQLMRMTLAQLVTKLNSKGFVWLRKRMMRMKLATLGWKEGLAADAHDARLAGPSTERIWQLMHMMLARLAAKMQTVWQLMRMTLAQLVTKLNSKGFVWLRKRMMRMKLATLGWKEGLAADAHDARLAGPSTERIWQLMHMMLARLAAKMQTVWQLMRMTLAQLVTKLNSKGFVWLRKRMMRMKLATLGWKEGLAADAHDARLAGPSTERIWQLMHMMLARLAAKMQTVWQLMRMTLAQLVTKLNSKGFVWLRKRMMRMKLATLGWKEGLAADAHDARLAGPSTERIWQLMHMMLARLAAKMQTVWQLMRMTLAQLVTKLNSKGFVWLRKRMMRMKLATLGWKGERELDTDEAVLRSGCFVTVGLEIRQQIGEQRARVEGRLLRLEETWQPAKMASSDVGSWLQSCILEVREAQETLEQTFESKFAGILRCLKALYMKVGLSAREALASLQDSHLELDDLWSASEQGLSEVASLVSRHGTTSISHISSHLPEASEIEDTGMVALPAGRAEPLGLETIPLEMGKLLFIKSQMGLLQEGILAIRLRPAVWGSLQNGQSGYMRGVDDPLLVLHDLAQITVHQNRCFYAVMGDFEKAFPSVWREDVLSLAAECPGVSGGVLHLLGDILDLDMVSVLLSGSSVVPVRQGLPEGFARAVLDVASRRARIQSWPRQDWYRQMFCEASRSPASWAARSSKLLQDWGIRDFSEGNMSLGLRAYKSYVTDALRDACLEKTRKALIPSTAPCINNAFPSRMPRLTLQNIVRRPASWNTLLATRAISRLRLDLLVLGCRADKPSRAREVQCVCCERLTVAPLAHTLLRCAAWSSFRSPRQLWEHASLQEILCLEPEAEGFEQLACMALAIQEYVKSFWAARPGALRRMWP